MWIVCNHHHGLVEVFVQTLKDFQHFGCRVAVEVSGRFVGQQQSGIADDGAGDGYALLLSAGELLGNT